MRCEQLVTNSAAGEGTTEIRQLPLRMMLAFGTESKNPCRPYQGAQQMHVAQSRPPVRKMTGRLSKGSMAPNASLRGQALDLFEKILHEYRPALVPRGQRANPSSTSHAGVVSRADAR